jgi:hypothetical protein
VQQQMFSALGAGFVRQKKAEEDAIFKKQTKDGIFFPPLFGLKNPASVNLDKWCINVPENR